MTNKGLKLRYCKECKKKRFCHKISVPNYNFKYTCSKGHSWILEGLTTERLDAALKDTFKFDRIFEKDNLFYEELRRRK